MGDKYIAPSRDLLESLLGGICNHVAKLHIEVIKGDGKVNKEIVTEGRITMIFAAAVMEVLSWDDNIKLCELDNDLIDHELSQEAIQIEINKIQDQMSTGPELANLLKAAGISMGETNAG